MGEVLLTFYQAYQDVLQKSRNLAADISQYGSSKLPDYKRVDFSYYCI